MRGENYIGDAEGYLEVEDDGGFYKINGISRRKSRVHR